MTNSKTKITDFTNGNITKQLAVFAFPLFLSNLLQVVYNMVDMIVVGKVMGQNGLSAVAVGGDITAFMTFIAIGFSNAGQVIISRYIGAGRRDKIGKFVSTMFPFLMSCAVVISIFCVFFRSELLKLMNAPDEAFSEALNYSTVCIVGLVFIYGYNIISAILRGMGDSKRPLIFVGVAAVINVILDIVFVAFLRMGAGGAALATVISQASSFICCTLFIVKHKAEYELNVKAIDFIKPDFAMLKELLGLGIPIAIKLASVQFSKLFVNSYINGYGVAVSAFAGIANKISSISNLISSSLNTAGSSMAGQNIAAGKFDRVKLIIRDLFIITLTIATIMTAAMCFFPEEIFSFFTDDNSEAVLAIAPAYVPIAAILFYASACRAGMNALINGSGNVKVNFATAIMDGIVLRIGLSLLFGIALGMGYMGFFLGDALAGFTPFVIGCVFYASGRWKKTNRN